MKSSGEASAPEAKKRKVAYTTFKKWKAEMDKDCQGGDGQGLPRRRWTRTAKAEMDKDCQTVMWLDCDKEVQAGKRFLMKLRCSTCAKFKTGIVTRRNFSEHWIAGTKSVRNSNIRDHAWSDQHTHAMNLLKREQHPPFLVIQSDELDILGALTSLLRTIKETEKLRSLPLAQWPVYSATLKKLKEENGKKVYMCQELKWFDEAESYYARHHRDKYNGRSSDISRTYRSRDRPRGIVV